LPWWIETLEQAAEWGIAPWELDPEENEIIWLYRWRIFKHELNRARKTKEQHGGSN
jgi:hypothetical protein